MKALFTLAGLAAGIALSPAGVQADGGYHHGHQGGGSHHGAWGRQHHHQHRHWGHDRASPVYRIQPYAYPYSGAVPYRSGFSVVTPNVYFRSRW